MITIEKIKEIVAKIAPEYNLKKVTLFGSRATGKNREDSDIDLIVEFDKNKIVTLFDIAGIKVDLEEFFGVGVDVLHGPKKDSWLIEIEKEIEIYAA